MTEKYFKIVFRVFFFFLIFWPCRTHGILVPRPGIEPVPPAVKVQSCSYWNTREVQSHFFKSILLRLGLPWWLSDKEATCQCMRHRRQGSNPWVGKIPWRRKRQPGPVFLSGKPHWTEEPDQLQSMRLHRVGHNWSEGTVSTFVCP